MPPPHSCSTTATRSPRSAWAPQPLNDAEVAPAIVAAIEAGYRHIDTAFRYGNQRGVGQGIRDSGVRREESSSPPSWTASTRATTARIAGLDECLQLLGLDYVDLLLIHWPLPSRDEYISTWKTFEKLAAAGKARSIGLSNFKPAHIERLLAETTTRPAANQIQLNPRITRPEHGRLRSANRGSSRWPGARWAPGPIC